MTDIDTMDLAAIEAEIEERGYRYVLIASHHHERSVWWRWKLYHGRGDLGVEIKPSSEFSAWPTKLEAARAALRYVRKEQKA